MPKKTKETPKNVEKLNIIKKEKPKNVASSSTKTAKSKASTKLLTKSVVSKAVSKSTSKKATTKGAVAKPATKSVSKKSTAKATTSKAPAKADSKKTTAKATTTKSATKTVSKKSTAKATTSKAPTKTDSKKTTAKATTTKSATKTVSKKSTTKATTSKAPAKADSKKTTAKATTTKSATKTVSKKSTTKATTSKATAKANSKKTTKALSEVSLDLSLTKTSVAKALTKTSKSKLPAKTPVNKALAKTSEKKITKRKTTAKPIIVPEYYDLPFHYNQTVVKVLAQTPKTLFVYWDVSDADREHYLNNYGPNFFNNTMPFLRVKNETNGTSFDVDVDDFANGWYLHVEDSKNTYSIELLRKQRPYVEKVLDNPVYITSSNIIETPNDHILLDNNLHTIFYRNVKTGEVTAKEVASISFLKRIGRIYNIYDLYKKIYKSEDVGEIFDLNNPGSGNPTSTFK